MKSSIKIGKNHIPLNSDVARFAYVPKNENGHEEYIYAFRGSSVPSCSTEPELYRNAKIVKQEKRETVLTFPNALTDVVLITKCGDDKFRRENPDIVRSMETFKIQETIRNGQKYITVYSK